LGSQSSYRKIKYIEKCFHRIETIDIDIENHLIKEVIDLKIFQIFKIKMIVVIFS